MRESIRDVIKSKCRPILEATVKKYEVRKDGSKYAVYQIIDEYPHDRLVLRMIPSKRTAGYLISALQGDRSAAQKWYRDTVNYNMKNKYVYTTPEEAYQSAAQDAKLLGFSPADVNADRNTFKPL